MIRYLVALVLAFAVYTTSNAQCPPRGEGQTEEDARLEQQEDFGMEEEEDMTADPEGEREYREQEEDFGIAPEEGQARPEDRVGVEQQPETIYESEDNKLRIKESPEGEVIINYNQEGLEPEGELDATGRDEGYGMEQEGEAALEEEEFEERFMSEDENLKVKENEDGEVIIKYRSEDAGMEQPEEEMEFEQQEDAPFEEEQHHEGVY